MGDNMKVNGDVHHLDHFVVAVMNPDRAEKFYTEVMGARTLKYENAPNMTRVFMKLGENHVGLFSQGKATLPKRENANSYPRHVGRVFILQSARAHDFGVKFFRPVRIHHRNDKVVQMMHVTVSFHITAHNNFSFLVFNSLAQ